jgi:hypothetical protein
MAEVSATCLASVRCVEAGVPGDGEGLSVGNRPEALPPGLSVEPVPFRFGRLPTASGEVDSVGGAAMKSEADDVGFADDVDVADDVGVGWLAAVTCTETDAAGSSTRSVVALTVAVSCADVTDDALAGMDMDA